jgi:hypothetical protein
MRFAPPFIAIGCLLAVGLPAEEPADRGGGGELAGRAIEELVEALADENFRAREEASRAIWEVGDAALPALRLAARSKDPEQAFRARELLGKIELHITPTTDPNIVALVELYAKSNASRKEAVMNQLRERRAWRQMLKLYAAETSPETRAALQASLEGVALDAARERLVAGDPAGAREFLELAPVNPASLLALASFHRAHGSLEQELERAQALEGPNGAAWRLALHRATGNTAMALKEAEAAGSPRVAAALALLTGDPIPWLTQNGPGGESGGTLESFPELAIRRWQQHKLPASDLEPFQRMLDRGDPGEQWMAAASLILLGNHVEVEKRHAKNSPREAFTHFDLMERVSEALRTFGLDPESPDYATWVAERVEQLSQVPDDEGEHSETLRELLTLANFLERRGMHDIAFQAFGPPFLQTAEDNVSRFSDMISGLIRSGYPRTDAPTLALRISREWAGEQKDRWEDMLHAAFGDHETINKWWEWMGQLEPESSFHERLTGLFALFDIGADPQNARQKWVDRIWRFIDSTPDEERAAYLQRVLFLTRFAPDVDTRLRAADQLLEEVEIGEHANLSEAPVLAAAER